MAEHFPKHMKQKAKEQDFRHEAIQYALWIPFALTCKYFNYINLANLFMTWFILGELMLVFMHYRFYLKWYNVLLLVVPVALYFVRDLMLTKNRFYMFFVEYVVFGTIAFAVVIPFLPQWVIDGGFDNSVVDFLRKVGFVKEKREKSSIVSTTSDTATTTTAVIK